MPVALLRRVRQIRAARVGLGDGLRRGGDTDDGNGDVALALRACRFVIALELSLEFDTPCSKSMLPTYGLGPSSVTAEFWSFV